MTIPPEIIGYAQDTQRKWQIPASLILSAAIIESDLGKKVPSGSNNDLDCNSIANKIFDIICVTSIYLWQRRKASTHTKYELLAIIDK